MLAVRHRWRQREPFAVANCGRSGRDVEGFGTRCGRCDEDRGHRRGDSGRDEGTNGPTMSPLVCKALDWSPQPRVRGAVWLGDRARSAVDWARSVVDWARSVVDWAQSAGIQARSALYPGIQVPDTENLGYIGAMESVTEREDITIARDGHVLAAWHYPPSSTDLTDADGRAPAVILAHGLGFTRDCGLDSYAQAFAQADPCSRLRLLGLR